MANPSEPPIALEYEQRLRADRGWAMDEGDRHFRRDDEVFQTLRRITGRLDRLAIDYAVVGGMALDAHGYRRLTVDVDLLVTREGLVQAQEGLAGLGYLPPFPGSRNLRDVASGVRIEFLVTGEYPGDGRPRAVAFPDPVSASESIDGIRYLRLVNLVELKLASGMTGGVARLRDLADVVALIESLDLPAGYADRLDSSVRPKYNELWVGLHRPDEADR